MDNEELLRRERSGAPGRLLARLFVWPRSPPGHLFAGIRRRMLKCGHPPAAVLA